MEDLVGGDALFAKAGPMNAVSVLGLHGTAPYRTSCTGALFAIHSTALYRTS